MRLENKVAIITGAAAGIGAATARLFCKEGAKVVGIDIDQTTLANTVAAITKEGGACIGLTADVSKSEDVRNVVNSALEKHQRGCPGVSRTLRRLGFSLEGATVPRFASVLWTLT